MAEELDLLRQEIERKSLELESLKSRLALKEREHKLANGYSAGLDHPCSEASQKKERLSNQDILRYSRQLILPEIGVKGQIKLCNASVLIVGAGGLGCPAAQYLAAAGVGCIGIVDYDTVEVSNLHRQVLHTEERVNISKAESIKIQLNQLNSSVQCIPYCMQLTSSNAIKIIENYDVVLDATDNVATRYLLSDSCVMAGKPLVSGSALRFEGQLTVYNYADGPCYRCLFPSPPPPESVGNCSDSGVLGPVPGIIGTLQALEAIKIAVGIKSSFCQKMLVYDALEGRFLTVKLRQRQQSCPICGDNPTINKLQDYELFCGASATDKTPSLKLLSKQERISVQEYKEILDQCAPHVLLDVREPVELDICHLPKSLNIPLKHLRNPESHEILKRALLLLAEEENTCNFRPVNVYVLCKEGNDSQKAVKILREQFYRDYTELLTREETSSSLQADSKQDTIDESRSFDVVFKDIAGGLYAWAQHIDKEFPIY
ncbi:adenylyltransferase and sulfurtransferase MOCS3-like isoform X1 [Montipora capricornis]|uniref:adenylyltransferase and sulfurtransferase MOCS3-like isoform X1 n=1 Tax=Montipora capricornis TaxID=246305 RepID=UPI0035F131E5